MGRALRQGATEYNIGRCAPLCTMVRWGRVDIHGVKHACGHREGPPRHESGVTMARATTRPPRHESLTLSDGLLHPQKLELDTQIEKREVGDAVLRWLRFS